MVMVILGVPIGNFFTLSWSVSDPKIVLNHLQMQ